MTTTAVLFIDTKLTAGGSSVAATPITDVPLLKRIVIDLRRAGIENIMTVMTERTPELEAILDDVRRTNFTRHTFSDTDWRKSLRAGTDHSVLVLTADRLCDYRFLENLAQARPSAPGRAMIAVDVKAEDAPAPNERRFFPNDGRVLEDGSAAQARRTGVYRLPAGEVADVREAAAGYFAQLADEHIARGTVDYFDIGNGFVQVIDGAAAVRIAEQRLIRYIWKSTDGKHGRMNKRLILPLLKVLLKTPLTPNMVSLLGVIVSIISGYFYARGQYLYAIVGGLLAVASSLLDHIDGCIARLKSKESAFGAHFDTICDYVFYVSFGLGATIGLYRSSGSQIYIWLGTAAFFGILISLVITSYRRNTFASNASAFATEAHSLLDQNLQNPIVRLGRKTYFVVRRPALPYYLLLLTAMYLLPFLLFMTALSSNLFWIFQVYTHKIFTPHPKQH